MGYKDMHLARLAVSAGLVAALGGVAVAPVVAVADDGAVEQVAANSSSVQLEGEGTEKSPYLVATAEQFVEAGKMSQLPSASTEAANATACKEVYIKLTDNVDLSTVNPSGGAYIKHFKGNIDGAGYTVSGAAYGSSVIENYYGGKITDLVWSFDNVCYLVLNGDAGEQYLYQNITMKGSVEYGPSNNNESPLIVYCGGNSTFDGVVNEAKLTSPTYNGIFVGYSVFQNSTYTFKNCVNKGTVSGERYGMFFGNACNHTRENYTINISDCRNEGSITSLKSANYIFGIGADSGEIKSKCDALIEQNPGLGKDNFKVVGTIEGVSLKGTSDGDLVVTLGNNEAVKQISTIKVVLSTYAKWKTASGIDQGTVLHNIEESIKVDGAQELSTIVAPLNINMEFYDGAGEMRSTGTGGSIKLIDANGKTYYALCNDDCASSLSNGEKHYLTNGTAKATAKAMLYGKSGDLLGVVDLDKNPFTESVESPQTISNANAGSKLESVTAPEGYVWLDPSQTIVFGEQTAFAKKGNVVVPVPIVGSALVADGLVYVVSDNGAEIVGTTDEFSSETVTIPEAIEGNKVVSIKSGALANTTSMKKLILPGSLMRIENNAFAFCSNLETIVWDNAAATSGIAPDDEMKPVVGNSAFIGCNATNKTVVLECGKPGYIDYMREHVSLGGFATSGTKWDVKHTKLTHVEYKAPTYTETGVKEHWVCDCGQKLYADSGMTTEVSASDVVIPTLVPTPPSGGGSTSDKTDVEHNQDGSTTTTVTKPDGSQTITHETATGTESVVKKDSEGNVTSTEVSVSKRDAESGKVELPIEKAEPAADASKAPEVEVKVPSTVTADKPVQVTVPVAKAEGAEPDYGIVVYAVDEDGNETVLPKCAVDEDGNVVFEAAGDVTIKVVDAAKDMPDVTDADWFAGGVVDFATARGIVNGVDTPSGKQFQGYGKTTRGMFVAMLHNLESNPDSASAGSLPDVPEGAFYADAAAWALGEGILSGVDMPDGTKQFQGGADVTREQVAVFLMRYAESLGMDVSARAEVGFPDASEVSAFARDAMSWAVAEGLFKGNDATGELNPTDGAARAEVAAVLMRFVSLMYA